MLSCCIEAKMHITINQLHLTNLKSKKSQCCTFMNHTEPNWTNCTKWLEVSKTSSNWWTLTVFSARNSECFTISSRLKCLFQHVLRTFCLCSWSRYCPMTDRKADINRQRWTVQITWQRWKILDKFLINSSAVWRWLDSMLYSAWNHTPYRT